jgi:hypothetical protein
MYGKVGKTFKRAHVSVCQSWFSGDRTRDTYSTDIRHLKPTGHTSSSLPSKTYPSARPDCPGRLEIEAYRRPAANCDSRRGSILASARIENSECLRWGEPTNEQPAHTLLFFVQAALYMVWQLFRLGRGIDWRCLWLSLLCHWLNILLWMHVRREGLIQIIRAHTCDSYHWRNGVASIWMIAFLTRVLVRTSSLFEALYTWKEARI